jgi:phosphonoacetaldehyde hydrolase
MWTIGLTRTGNLIGLDRQEWAQLPEATQKDRLREAESILRKAGADYIAGDLPSCNRALSEIELRLNHRD